MLENKEGREGEELEVTILSRVIKSDSLRRLKPEGGEKGAMMGTEREHFTQVLKTVRAKIQGGNVPGLFAVQQGGHCSQR